MSSLRKQLIRLAYQQPELRKDLLPLLRVAVGIGIPRVSREQVLDYMLNAYEHVSSPAEAQRSLVQRGFDPLFVQTLLSVWNKERPDLTSNLMLQQMQAEDLVNRVVKQTGIRLRKTASKKPTPSEKAEAKKLFDKWRKDAPSGSDMDDLDDSWQSFIDGDITLKELKDNPPEFD